MAKKNYVWKVKEMSELGKFETEGFTKPNLLLWHGI